MGFLADKGTVDAGPYWSAKERTVKSRNFGETPHASSLSSRNDLWISALYRSNLGCLGNVQACVRRVRAWRCFRGRVLDSRLSLESSYYEVTFLWPCLVTLSRAQTCKGWIVRLPAEHETVRMASSCSEVKTYVVSRNRCQRIWQDSLS